MAKTLTKTTSVAVAKQLNNTKGVSAYISSGSSGGIGDAPKDGNQYARKDGEWVEDYVLSDEQKTVINDLVDEKYPLSISATGAKWLETGTSYTPTGLITAKRGSTDITKAATITCVSGDATIGDYTTDGLPWSADTITSGKTYVFKAAYNSKSVTGNVTVSYRPYLYYGVVDSVPDEMAETWIKGNLNSVLSNDTTKDTTTLAANKYYVFACMGSVTFGLSSVSPDGTITGFTQGTLSIARKNGTGTDVYSYIVVPASQVAWKFKITNV